MKNKTSHTNKSKSRRFRWLWHIGLMAVITLIGIVILVKHQPKTYQPLQPDNPEQVSLYLTHELGPALFNQIQYEQPFELIVRQSGINDIISRWPWPEQIGKMSFSDPVITFSDEAVILMGTLEIRNIGSVVTLIAAPTMTPEGQLHLNIQAIRLGRVPVTTLIAKLSKEAFAMNQDAFSDDPNAAAIVKSIINNEPFDPVFQISERNVRITGFSLSPGVLNLNLLPEN